MKNIYSGKFDNLLGLEKSVVEEKDEYERMELYIKCDYLKTLFGVDTDRNKLHKAQRLILFRMNGEEIADRKRYKIEDQFLGIKNDEDEEEDICNEEMAMMDD